MSVISTVLVLGVIVEALIEYGKLIFVNKAIVWKQVASLFLGVLLACLTGSDLFKAVGIVFVVPYVGIVLTGIIFSRGSNYASDFIKLIQGVGTKAVIPVDADGDEGAEEVTEDNTDAVQTAAATEPITPRAPSDGSEGSAS